tara:strand:- start:1733 stop:2347 length:615 start_codon:yes stop_codon:yes gene_type:complete
MESQRLLAKLVNYPVTKWFNKAIQALAIDLRTILQTASGVISGAVAAGGTVTATALGITTTGALEAKVNGVIKASLAALTDVDLFTTAGSVAQAVYQDGSTAAAADLVAASADVAQVTLLAFDSDGAGAATGDNGALLYVAIIAGTAATWPAQTVPLTDAEIRAALLLSTGVHDGTTGFVRLADIVWDEGGSAPVATVTVNRDT